MKQTISAFYVACLGLACAALVPAVALGQETEVPAGCRAESAADLLADFLAVDAPKRAPSEDSSSMLKALDREQAEVEFLLATVPEPRLGFDGVVEAVSQALEVTGNTLDRYALPWSHRPEKGNVPCQEYVPGVALYVKTLSGAAPRAGETSIGSRRHLLVVYFIGELPTAGIYRPAFLRALHELVTLRGQLSSGRCRNCTSVRLLGPAFSGGVASLEELLEHPAVRDLPFTILSGRATSSEIRPVLERHSRPDRRVSYHATVIPDDVLQTEFFCYLTETLGADDHDIALLTESSTVFGRLASDSPDGSPMSQPTSALPKSSRCQRAHRPRLALPVPLHISRLNAAWAARQSPAAKSSSQDPAGLVESSLSTATGRALPKASLDVSERVDMIPTMSPSTVVTVDRSLATILTTIAAERVRYVGLIFTDVQDTLFLAEEIRKYSPDVVLFTFDSNILYAHPDARALLKGMLTVSTYPLFTRNQQWSYPFDGYSRRIQFARDIDQGVYNATLGLVGRSDVLLEYSQPIGLAGTPVHPRPPVWVSTVGIETLIPLAFITDYKDEEYVYKNPIKPQAKHQHLYAPYQQGTLSALLLALGFCGILIAAGYFRSYYASPSDEPGYPWGFFRLFRRYGVHGPQSLDSDRPQPSPAAISRKEVKYQPFFALAIFLPMALLYPFFTTVHFVQLRDGNTGVEAGMSLRELPMWMQLLHHSSHIGIYEDLTVRVLSVGLFAAAAQVVFMVTAGDLLLHCARRGHGLRHWLARRWERSSRLSLAALGALFVLGTLALFRGYVAVVNVLQQDFNNLVFMRRAAHPAFGVSPLTPLLILISALQLWGYSNLQRIRLLDKQAMVILDYFVKELERRIKLQEQLKRISEQLQSPGLIRLLLGGGLMAALTLSLFSDIVSLEPFQLNFIFRLLFAILSVGIIFAAYRFLRVWMHFSRFLDLFTHHPLVQALERMPEALSRSIGSLFLEELPEMARQEAEQTHLRLLYNHLQLMDLDAQLKALPAAEVEALRPMFAEVRESLAPHAAPEAGGAPEYDEMQMVKVCQGLLRILGRFWQSRPLPGTLPEPAAVPANLSTATVYGKAMPAGLSLWLRLGEDFIAIQVVAYIHRLFPHLRNALIFFTGALLLMLAAVVTYPFQPQHFLNLVLWTLMLGGVFLTVMVFVQMNRNDTLSRIAKTEPGKISFDRRFLSQVIIYGLLPLLSLLAAQFPEVRGVAFSWFETILKTLK